MQQEQHPTGYFAFIRRGLRHFNSCCGGNRKPVSRLAGETLKKIRRGCTNTSELSNTNLYYSFESDETIFELRCRQENMANEFELEVMSTSVDEIGDEIIKGNGHSFKKITNNNVWNPIGNKQMVRFTPLDIKCTHSLLATSQGSVDEGNCNQGMEASTLIGSSENLSIDHQCRVAPEVGQAEIDCVTPIHLKRLTSLQSKAETTFVEELEDEAIGRITPPADFQSDEVIFPKPLDGTPVKLTNLENTSINQSGVTENPNVDKLASVSTDIKCSTPKIVGVKYAPIVCDVLNSSLGESQAKGSVAVGDGEASKDGLIIRELVMERFAPAVRKFAKRRLRRQWSRQVSSSSCDERPVPLEPYVQIYFGNTHEQVSSNDSGLEDMTAETFKGNSSDTSDSSNAGKELAEYDSQEFLKEALGEYLDITCESQEKLEVMPKQSRPQNRSMYDTERSIGTSEISTLVSNIYGNKSGEYSLYSTIQKPARKRPLASKKTSIVRPQTGTYTRYYEYASINNFKMNQKAEELVKEVDRLQTVIDQVSKALLLCRDKPKFFGDVPHIEAEKLLVLSTYKKELLDKEINKDEYEDLEQGQRVATVKILNLKCFTTPQAAPTKNEVRYYLCLIHCGVSVLASEIVTPEANGVVTFPPNCFQFQELTSDFEIDISIYGMVVGNNKKNMSHNSKRSKKISDADRASSLTPLFELLGTCKIGISDLNRNVFKLENMPCNTTISDQLVADIKSCLEIKNQTKGFLNIGTTCSVWNRKWCYLDGHHLKYWNYPSDEHDMEPGTFDLSYCLTCPVDRVDKSVCARARTFMLEMDEGRDKRSYFFSADSLAEFEEWKRQLTSVLIILRNWNKSRC